MKVQTQIIPPNRPIARKTRLKQKTQPCEVKIYFQSWFYVCRSVCRDITIQYIFITHFNTQEERSDVEFIVILRKKVSELWWTLDVAACCADHLDMRASAAHARPSSASYVVC